MITEEQIIDAVYNGVHYPYPVAAVKALLSEAWEEGYGAGQRTDVAAETQAPNPYEDLKTFGAPTDAGTGYLKSVLGGLT